jgi:hypothetical protein
MVGKTIFSAMIAGVLLPIFAAAADEETTIFGPVVASPGLRQDVTHYSIAVRAGIRPPFTLRVQNGDADGRLRASSAVISINSVEVVSPSALNQQVGSLERDVQLRLINDVAVQIKSAPGSVVSFAVSGRRATPDAVLDENQSKISSDGGTMSLGELASLTLPSQSAMRPTQVTLAKVFWSDKLSLYLSETADAGPAMSELLSIRSSETILKALALAVKIPPDFVKSLPSDHSPDLFAQFIEPGSAWSIDRMILPPGR